MEEFSSSDDAAPIGEVLRGYNPFAASATDVPEKSRDEAFIDAVTYAIPSAMAGFVDTFGTSIGVIDDGDVEAGLRNILPSVGAEFSRNKAAYQTVGDLGGMLLTGTAALKLFRGSKNLLGVINGGKRSRFLDTVFGRAGAYEKQLKFIQSRDRFLARRGTEDLTTDTLRQTLTRDLALGGAANVIAESAAFELGVYATMNDSQTLYPDEFSTVELIAMNMALPVTATGVSFLRARKAVRISAQDTAGIAQTVLNPKGLPLNDLLTRGENRHVSATVWANAWKDVNDALTTTLEREAKLAAEGPGGNFRLKKENLTKAKTVYEANMTQDVKKMFADKKYPFLTASRLDNGSPEVQNIVAGLKKDPYLLLNAVSLEHLPGDFEALQGLKQLRGDQITKRADEIHKLTNSLSKLDSAGYDEAVARIDLLKKENNDLLSLEYYVVENDGAVVDAALRKPIYQDGQINIKKKPGTQLEPGMFEIRTRGDTLFKTEDKVLAVTDDMQLIIPGKVDKTRISNINVTKVLPVSAQLQSPEYFKTLLRDIAEDWHLFKAGKAARNRGQEIFEQLTPDVKSALHAWKDVASASPIRRWFKEGDANGTELYTAFAPLRKRLAEIADADGTIPLMRGESKAETANPTNDVVSMTSDPRVAKAFSNGTNIIVRRVPVEDVIAVVGGLGDEFEYIVKGNTKRNLGQPVNAGNWEALTLGERSAAYAGMQRAVENWKPGVKINVSVNDHHIRLDAVTELYAKHGDAIFNDITLPSGFNTIEDIEFASLGKKYEEYIRLRKMNDSAGQIKISENQKLNNEDIRKMINLPGTQTDVPHPLVNAFEALYQRGNQNLKHAVNSLDGFKQFTQDTALFPNITPVTKEASAGLELQGGMLNYNYKQKPSVLVKRPLSDEQSRSRDYLQHAVTLDRSRIMEGMQNASREGADLVEIITKEFTNRPEMMAVAKRTDQLVEGGQRSSGIISQQSHAMGETPALNNMHNLRLLSDKAARKYIGQEWQKVNPILNQIKNPNNAADLSNFFAYAHARRQGWDVATEAAQLDNKLMGFTLQKTKRNADRFKKMFGEEMPEGALMPTPGTGFKNGVLEYKPLAMTDLAFQTATAVNHIDNVVLRNNNFLAKMMGRPQVRQRPWHVPAINFGKTENVFILSEAGELISVVPGRTRQEAQTLAEQEVKNRGHGIIIDSRDLGQYFKLQDEAFSRMADYADPLVQTGPITGKQVGSIIGTGPEALTQMIQQQERLFESVIRRSREVLFAPEINVAKTKLNIATPETAKTGKSIFNKYVNEITGNPQLSPNEILGKAYYSIEDIWDRSLEVLHDKVLSQFNPAVATRIAASKKDDKIYSQLQKQLGEHNPFTSALDFANKTHNVQTPANMKSQMAKLNSFTTLMTLRFAEISHSLLTLTSLPATMPAVIAGMRMNPEEIGAGAQGLARFKARTQAYGVGIDKENAAWSPTRALISGTHFMFSKEGQRVWKEASEAGFMDQQVAEMFKTITGPAEGYAAGIFRRATNMASVLSDKSERVARGISFMTGYNYGKRALGITDDDLLFAFANKFANDTIGDYSPNNRPRIFQGAVGMPLGLFMTFTWNYYQRLFGYIENAQTRALVTQFATQASVFGAQTVPGFDQYSELFFQNYDGNLNPVDAMENRFGSEFTEWFMYGTVSNLPKMFGFDDGVALYTRGDINFTKIPTILTPGDIPSVQMVKKSLDAARETFNMLRERGGFDGNQMAEIVQNYSTNRTMRSMASLFTGYVTDRRGQVVDSSPSFNDIFKGEIQNETALFARLTGLRTLNESRRVEMNSRIKGIDLSRRYRMGALRDVLRSEFRKTKPDDDVINNAFASYIRYGGSPDYFPTWVAEQFMKSRTDKASLDAMAWINSPQKSDNVLRLMHVLSQSPPKEMRE